MMLLLGGSFRSVTLFTIFFVLAGVNAEGNENKVFAPKKVFRPLSTKVHIALFLVQYEGVSELAGNGVPTCLVVQPQSIT